MTPKLVWRVFKCCERSLSSVCESAKISTYHSPPPHLKAQPRPHPTLFVPTSICTHPPPSPPQHLTHCMSSLMWSVSLLCTPTSVVVYHIVILYGTLLLYIQHTWRDHHHTTSVSCITFSLTSCLPHLCQHIHVFCHPHHTYLDMYAQTLSATIISIQFMAHETAWLR